jgi:hypothetical protein
MYLGSNTGYEEVPEVWARNGPGLDRSPPNMPLQGPFTLGITTTPQKEEERKTNGPVVCICCMNMPLQYILYITIPNIIYIYIYITILNILYIYELIRADSRA